MSAPSIEAIFQFEEAIENAAKSILTNSAGLTAYRQHDTGNVSAPFVALQLSGVTATETQHADGSGNGWPSDMSATLHATVITNRVKEGGTSTHNATLGKVRRYLYDLSQWSDALLPYHKIWLVMENGSSPTSSDDDRLDMTALSFQIRILIRDQAWP